MRRESEKQIWFSERLIIYSGYNNKSYENI